MSEERAPYTPGPWISKREGSTICIHGPGAKDKYIAEMAIEDSAGIIPGNQLADSRLIAAAPELLEALETMVERAGMRYPHFEQGNGAEDLATVRAAIAKALGK